MIPLYSRTRFSFSCLIKSSLDIPAFGLRVSSNVEFNQPSFYSRGSLILG